MELPPTLPCLRMSKPRSRHPHRRLRLNLSLPQHPLVIHLPLRRSRRKKLYLNRHTRLIIPRRRRCPKASLRQHFLRPSLLQDPTAIATTLWGHLHRWIFYYETVSVCKTMNFVIPATRRTWIISAPFHILDLPLQNVSEMRGNYCLSLTLPPRYSIDT